MHEVELSHMQAKKVADLVEQGGKVTNVQVEIRLGNATATIDSYGRVVWHDNETLQGAWVKDLEELMP